MEFVQSLIIGNAFNDSRCSFLFFCFFPNRKHLPALFIFNISILVYNITTYLFLFPVVTGLEV